MSHAIDSISTVNAPFDILVLGKKGVGKTTLIQKYVLGDQPVSPQDTSECITFKTIAVPGDGPADTGNSGPSASIHKQISILDSSAEVNDLLTSDSYQINNARTMLFAYAVDDSDSFEALDYTINCITSVRQQLPPRLVVCLKMDKNIDRQVSFEHGKQLASQCGALDFIEACAAAQVSVDHVFAALVEEVLRIQGQESEGGGSQLLGVASNGGISRGEWNTFREESNGDTSRGESNGDTSRGESNRNTSSEESNGDTSRGEPNGDTSRGESNRNTSRGESNRNTSRGESNRNTSSEESNRNKPRGESNRNTSSEESNRNKPSEESNGNTPRNTSREESPRKQSKQLSDKNSSQSAHQEESARNESVQAKTLISGSLTEVRSGDRTPKYDPLSLMGKDKVTKASSVKSLVKRQSSELTRCDDPNTSIKPSYRQRMPSSKSCRNSEGRCCVLM